MESAGGRSRAAAPPRALRGRPRGIRWAPAAAASRSSHPGWDSVDGTGPAAHISCGVGETDVVGALARRPCAAYTHRMPIGVIDIGTNTLLLLIVDDAMRPLIDLCRFGRLGKGLADQQQIGR